VRKSRERPSISLLLCATKITDVPFIQEQL
jgi:hypothetical protein